MLYHLHHLWVQEVETNVSPPPISVLTNQTALEDRQNIIPRSHDQLPTKILGQKAKSNH